MKAKDSYKKLYEGSSTLWNLLVTRADSNNIISKAYEIIGNPLMITTENVLFKSIGVKSNDIIDKLFMAGFDESKCKDSVFYISSDELPLLNTEVRFGLVVAGIHSDSQYLGRVIILGQNHPLEDIDLEYARTLSKIMPTIFLNEVFPQMSIVVPDFPLFHSLITGERLDSVRLTKKINSLNYVPEEGMNVIVIEQRNQSILTALSNMEKYANLLSCKIYSMYKGNIVTINSRSNAQKLNLNETIQKELKKDNFRCGISREFFNLSDTKRMYKQAIFSISISDFFDSDTNISEFEDWSDEYNIWQHSHTSNPVDMLDPRFIKLKKYDDDGPQYLLETLKVHLKNLKTPTQGANTLYVHRNTYFHRLNKIQEITGWDLNDGDCLSKINLYLKITRMLNQAEEKNAANYSSIICDE